MKTKPAKLCTLTKGKITDAHKGFVDTFNWMVDVLDTLSKSTIYVVDSGEYSSKNHKLTLKRVKLSNLIKGNGTTEDQTVFTATPISEE